METGADPNEQDEVAGLNALMWASLKEKPSVVECLLVHGGSDLDAVSRVGGATALHHAASNSETRVVRLLLEAGANPTLLDEGGQTPLDVARSRSRHGCVVLLEVRG